MLPQICVTLIFGTNSSVLGFAKTRREFPFRAANAVRPT